MRESSKAALCGISSGLAIVVMMTTYFAPELLVYTAPPVAGLLVTFIVEELGKKWAGGVYAAISLLSVFLIADKEAAVFFTFFFGWYPIIKPVLDEKIRIKALRLILKLIIFNCSLAASVAVSNYVFHIDYSDFGEGGKIFIAVFWVLFIVLLTFYDVLVSKMILLYRVKLQKKIRKMFKK